MRAEVLYRLGHFRSSLADADNAIKCRPTSHNVSMTSSLLSSHRRTISTQKLALEIDSNNNIKIKLINYNSYLQAYLYRALTFAALGLTDDAIISYCLSIHFNRTLTAHSKSNRLEVAKVCILKKFAKKAKKKKNCISFC